jgi:hypothetical protein
MHSAGGVQVLNPWPRDGTTQTQWILMYVYIRLRQVARFTSVHCASVLESATASKHAQEVRTSKHAQEVRTRTQSHSTPHHGFSATSEHRPLHTSPSPLHVFPADSLCNSSKSIQVSARTPPDRSSCVKPLAPVCFCTPRQQSTTGLPARHITPFPSRDAGVRCPSLAHPLLHTRKWHRR